MEVVNLEDKFARFSEHWSPKILARLNDYHVKAVKLRGEFVWHKHDTTDELFLVTAGRLTIRFRDREVELGPGELVVVPKGVEHQPVQFLAQLVQAAADRQVQAQRPAGHGERQRRRVPLAEALEDVEHRHVPRLGDQLDGPPDHVLGLERHDVVAG